MNIIGQQGRGQRIAGAAHIAFAIKSELHQPVLLHSRTALHTHNLFVLRHQRASLPFFDGFDAASAAVVRRQLS